MALTIHSYHHKPEAVFHRAPREKCSVFYGVELETVRQEDFNEYETELETLERKNLIYCKHDGSLPDRGMEIVTHPMTLFFHQESDLWEKICEEDISSDYEECGLHIHISRTGFKDAVHLYSFIVFLNTYSKLVRAIAGRPWNQYCEPINEDDLNRVESANNVNFKGGERYSIVNLQNTHTVEVRIFDADVDRRSILAKIEFCDAVRVFTQNNPTGDVVNDFLEFLNKNTKKYFNLLYMLDVDESMTDPTLFRKIA